MKTFTKYITLFTLLFFISNASFGTSYTWTGSTSTSWSVTSNWSPAGVPGSSDNVTIGSTTRQVVLDQNRTITNLTITTDTLFLNGDTLTVNGTLTGTSGKITNGLLKCRGSVTAFNGTLIDAEVDAVGGVVRFSGSTFTKKVSAEANGASTSTGSGGCTFNDSLKLKLSSNGVYLKMATSSGNTFQGPVIITNTGDHEIMMSDAGTSYYNNNIEVNSTSTGGVVFGNNGGASELASGKTIAIGTTGFTNNYLTLKNFTQLGSTSQSLTLTSSGVLVLTSCTFNGSLTVSGPGFLLKNNTFNGTSSFTKSGSSAMHSDGGNTFNGNVTFSNTGSAGRIRLSTTIADNYYGNATFQSTGQDIQVCYSGITEFKGDLAINHSAVNFNSNTGTSKFTGTNAQSLNGSSFNFSFKNLTIDKPTNNLRANTTLSVDGVLTLNSGNLETTTANLLTMKAGSSATASNSNSFISGPIKKIGSTAFDFPIGKNQKIRKCSISAPSISTDAFTAEYFDTNQSQGSNSDTIIKYLSNCEYWTLSRDYGSSNVSIKLSFDSTYCNLLDSAKCVIINWSSSTWKNLGNGGITGNKNSGTLVNSSTILSYSQFGIGYLKCFLEADAGVNKQMCLSSSIGIGGSPSAKNGSAPYVYKWNSSLDLNDSTSANPTTSTPVDKDYYLTVLDNKGCISTDTISIDIYPELNIATTISNVTCHGLFDGSISTVVTGGNTPYTYLWLPDSSSNDALTNLPAGQYSIKIQDSTNCFLQRNIYLDQPPQIRNIFSIKNVSCYSKHDGSVISFPRGGTKPYSFHWSSQNNDSSYNYNLYADTLVLTLTDSNGCSINDTAVVSEPSQISIDLVSTKSDTLYEGIISEFIAEPNLYSNYKFFINNSCLQNSSSNKFSTSNLNNNDTLILKASQSNNCSVVDTVIVTVVPKNEVLFTNSSINYCSNFATPFSIEIDSPTLGMTYSWFKNGVLIDSITGPIYLESDPPVFSTVYLAKSYDNSKYSQFSVNVQPISMTFTVNPPNCYGESDASIDVIGRGGSGIYSYSIDSNSYGSNNEWTGLNTGSHTFTVIDNMGCASSAVLVIPEISSNTTVEE